MAPCQGVPRRKLSTKVLTVKNVITVKTADKVKMPPAAPQLRILGAI